MNLKEAVNVAASATQAKGTMPILSMLAIKSELGSMEFTGTDLETGIKTKAIYDAPDFSCCVDAKRLVAAINIIDNPKFKVTEKQLIVQQGSMRFALPWLHYDSYPDLVGIDDTGVKIDGDIANMMAEVRYAVAKNDVRFYLNGICLRSEHGKLSIIASDGHRLAVRYKKTDQDFKVILPAKTVNQIIKHQPDYLVIGEKVSAFKDGFKMVCTPIQHTYPDFSKIMKEGNESISFSKKDINLTLSALNTLRDVSPFLGVRLEWSHDELSLSASGNDYSEVDNKLPSQSTEPGEIAVNAGYLADLVHAINDENICLEFNEHLLMSRRDNAVDVVMSMRL